jgi:hypothetical protein
MAFTAYLAQFHPPHSHPHPPPILPVFYSNYHRFLCPPTLASHSHSPRLLFQSFLSFVSLFLVVSCRFTCFLFQCLLSLFAYFQVHFYIYHIFILPSLALLFHPLCLLCSFFLSVIPILPASNYFQCLLPFSPFHYPITSLVIRVHDCLLFLLSLYHILSLTFLS